MRTGAAAFAGAVLAVGIGYAVMATNMPRGTLAYPGPGFFPVIIGAFLIATALGCLAQDLLAARERDHGGETPSAGTRHPAKTVQLVALLVAYLFALKPLGFPLAICAFVVCAIRIFGYRKWLPALAMAAAIAAISYVAFVVWLAVPLPLGLLEPLLG